MLFEYFNTTNQTSPHYEKHLNFVDDIKDPICHMVEFTEPSLRCAYVKTTQTCIDSHFVVNYIQIYYCYLKPTDMVTITFSVLLLIAFCIYLFEILGLTAGGFLTPSLKVLSKIFNLSEAVAGNTLLALSNSAPDVLSNLASIEVVESSIYADIYGSVLCSVLIVAGILIVFRPIVVEPFQHLRDVGFLLLGVIYVEYCLASDKGISLAGGICIILLYFSYIIVVILDQALLHRAARQLAALMANDNTEDVESKYLKVQAEANLTFMSRHTTTTEKYIIDANDTKYEYYDPVHSKNYLIFWLLWQTLRPYDLDSWNNAKCFKRFLIVARMPIIFILKLVVPVVDYELPMHGWCKLLHSFQIFTVPTFLTACLWGFKPRFAGMPVCGFVCCALFPFGLLIFFTSRTDLAPPYFKFFSFPAIISSAYLVYALAKECVAIMDLIGITTHRSSGFLSCTLLAFGNSIGGLISNYTLLKQGYSQMGFSSCYSGPLLNSLLSLGICYTYQVLQTANMRYKVGVGIYGSTCTVFLVISLILFLFACLITNFVLRRSLGIFLLSLYGLFFFYCLLTEFEVIHGYGTDHRMNIKPFMFS